MNTYIYIYNIHIILYTVCDINDMILVYDTLYSHIAFIIHSHTLNTYITYMRLYIHFIIGPLYRYITLQTLHYIALHYTTLHHNTLHYSTLHCITSFFCFYKYHCILQHDTLQHYTLHITTLHTSSTAQGGGGSFKNRKPIGDVGCCESGMAERSH